MVRAICVPVARLLGVIVVGTTHGYTAMALYAHT